MVDATPVAVPRPRSRSYPHEGRHTALSLMEKAGVPISVVSRWAGHHDASFTLRQYVHADHTEDMRQGTVALGQLYKIEQTV